MINSTVPLEDGQPLVEPNLDPKVSMFTAADHWWVQIGAFETGSLSGAGCGGSRRHFQFRRDGGHTVTAGLNGRCPFARTSTAISCLVAL